jgi:hypothetical protein
MSKTPNMSVPIGPEAVSAILDRDWGPTDEQGAALAPLLGQVARGGRRRLTKIGERRGDGTYADIQPEWVISGVARLVDRGGAPALYVRSSSEWFVTSAVLRSEPDPSGMGGVALWTENSVYNLR